MTANPLFISGRWRNTSLASLNDTGSGGKDAAIRLNQEAVKQ